jgi:hypothetical protein
MKRPLLFIAASLRIGCRTIRVKPGTYAEAPISINKSVRIEALNGPVTIR